MTDDRVTFGGIKQILPLEHAEAKRVLEAAEAALGDEVLTEWEENFARGSLKGIREQGFRWSLTSNRQDAINTIEKKLTKEGLL